MNQVNNIRDIKKTKQTTYQQNELTDQNDPKKILEVLFYINNS